MGQTYPIKVRNKMRHRSVIWKFIDVLIALYLIKLFFYEIVPSIELHTGLNPVLIVTISIVVLIVIAYQLDFIKRSWFKFE
jgi:hypothetical protein